MGGQTERERKNTRLSYSIVFEVLISEGCVYDKVVVVNTDSEGMH